MDSKTAEGKYNILDKYAQNITEEARLGKLDPVQSAGMMKFAV